MTFRSPGLLRIPKYSIVTRLVTAEDITFDVFGKESSRERTDLTDGTVYFTVKDAQGNIVIQKTSDDISEIELKDQVSLITRGQAIIKFVEADTAALNATTEGGKYWFDVWVRTSDGREEPIVDCGRFYVDKSVTRISDGPAPSIPIAPATQNPQQRSFRWVAPTGGDTFTVTVPGTGMADTTYGVWASYEDIPGAVPSQCRIPSVTRLVGSFDVEFSSSLSPGDSVIFLLRDI